MHSKKIKNKEDVDLHTGCKNPNEIVWGFIFEKEDKNGRGAEDLVVFYENIASQSGNNFVVLICQY